MSSAPRPLGVLGGMGPLATAKFYEELVRATPAHIDQDHIRTVIWSDPAVPDRTAAILGAGPSPVPALVAGARALRRMGARVFATPCNTAHRYLPEVSRIARIRMIDMVDETVRHAASAGAERLGILATQGTRIAGLYDVAGARHGLIVIYPSEQAQLQLVDPAIRMVKSGTAPDRAAEMIASAAVSLSDAGADAVVAACTEIPSVMEPAAELVDMVDSIRCLAVACVRDIRAMQGVHSAA